MLLLQSQAILLPSESYKITAQEVCTSISFGRWMENRITYIYLALKVEQRLGRPSGKSSE